MTPPPDASDAPNRVWSHTWDLSEDFLNALSTLPSPRYLHGIPLSHQVLPLSPFYCSRSSRVLVEICECRVEIGDLNGGLRLDYRGLSVDG